MSEKNDKPLSQVEARLVADFLKQKGKDPSKGWVTIWKLSPSQVAESYKVNINDVMNAARRK